MGRWVSRDPIGEAGGVNLVAFVGNAPVSRSDGLGLYDKDVHYYLVYLLLRAKCFTQQEADIVAGFSQGIDDNPSTEPILAAASTRARYHFPGSTPSSATRRNDPGVRAQVRRASDACGCGPIQQDLKSYKLGEALHAIADTFAHEGFTAWENTTVNIRTGSMRPNIGHADAPDGGHSPDIPSNDVAKALQAAKTMYDLLPDRCKCNRDEKGISWEEIYDGLKKTLARQGDEDARSGNMQNFIAGFLGQEPPTYDKNRFSIIPSR